MAKDSPNVIENSEVALYFPPEAHVSEISSSSVNAILDQTDTTIFFAYEQPERLCQIHEPVCF